MAPTKALAPHHYTLRTTRLQDICRIWLLAAGVGHSAVDRVVRSSVLQRKRRSLFEFSLPVVCLSRACLGKMTSFSIKWLKITTRFLTCEKAARFCRAVLFGCFIAGTCSSDGVVRVIQQVMKMVDLPRQARDKQKKEDLLHLFPPHPGESLRAELCALAEASRPRCAGAHRLPGRRLGEGRQDIHLQKNASVSRESLCLSRACLGKLIGFSIKWCKRELSHTVSTRAAVREGAIPGTRIMSGILAPISKFVYFSQQP